MGPLWHIECLPFSPQRILSWAAPLKKKCLLSTDHDNKHVMETLADEPRPLHKFQAWKPLYQIHITDNDKGTAAEKSGIWAALEQVCFR